MAEILLTSARFVKDATSISDNIAGKFLLPSIREVQETRLRTILGSCLLERLKSLVAGGQAELEKEENAQYKELLDRLQYFLAYAASAEVCIKTSYKVANFGVVKTTDENVSTAPFDEVAKTKDYYIFKSDAECLQLQRWILQNQASFPELRECECSAMRANLRSSASSGLWLGGARGKKLPGGGGCCQ